MAEDYLWVYLYIVGCWWVRRCLIHVVGRAICCVEGFCAWDSVMVLKVGSALIPSDKVRNAKF